jgi:glycosyltransferase involved in cell wall biosynthesis
LLEEPLVSIIIPARNSEGLIGRTLASAVIQTYRNFEVIVVDDGSTDRTAAIVKAAALHDPRIRLFSRPHSGLPATRNFGISQARGSLIAPLDSDDLWHSEKIARQVAKIQSSPKIGVVFCWILEIDEDDFIIPPIRNQSVAEGNVIAEVAATASGSLPSTQLIRRSDLEAVGGYDPHQTPGSEDWKLNFALAEICEFAVVPARLVGYRRTSGAMSRNVRAMEEGTELVSRWILSRWPDMPKEVRQKMIYNMNGFLAHSALTNNRFVDAIRYKVKSYRARPSEMLAPEVAIFVGRLAVRMLGLNQRVLKIRRRISSYREKFNQFQDIGS